MATFFDPLSGNLISSPDKIQSGGDLQELINIDDLLDVDTSTTPPTDGQILTWVNANNQWEPSSIDGTSLTFSAGTEALPSIAFNGDPNTGIYSPGADQVAISTGGTGRLFVNADGSIDAGSGANATFTLSGSVNSFLKLKAGNTGGSFVNFSDVDADGIGQIRYLHASDSMLFYTNSTEHLRITNVGNVGIGTSSPLFQLVVEGPTPHLQLKQTATNTGDSRLIFADGDSATPGQLVFDHTNNSLQTIINGTERMRITSAGNVGIGLTAPTVPFDMVGTSSWRSDIGGTDRWQRFSGGAGLIYDGTTTNTAVAFITNGGERLRITDAGNVGIGTTSPGQALDVVGVVSSQNNAAAIVHFQAQDTGAATDERTWRIAQTDRATKSLSLGVSVNDAANTAYAPIRITRSGTSLDSIQFATGNGAERMRIDSAGNVGIGTTNPTSALHVLTSGAGQIRHSDGTRAAALGSTGTTSYVGSVSAGQDFALFAAGSEAMRIDSAGKVGIGTTTPGAPLTTYTASPNTDNTSAVCELRNTSATPVAGTDNVNVFRLVSNTSNGYTAALIGLGKYENSSSGKGEVKIKVAETSLSANLAEFSFRGDGRFTVPGNVGIGTTSPGAKLEIVGGQNGVRSLRDTGTGALTAADFGGGIAFGTSSAGSAAYLGGNIQLSADQTWTAGTSHPSSLLFSTASSGSTSPTERMRIDSAGRLLVGTSSGSNLVQIDTGTLGTTGSGTSGALYHISRRNSTALSLALENRGTADAATPSNAGTQIGFYGYTGSASSLMGTIDCQADGQTVAAGDSPGRLVFSTTADGASSPTERMRIDSAGNVGIGTSSPEEVLDVNGPIVWRGALATSKTSAGALDRSGNDLRIRAYGATAGTGQLVFRTGGGGGSVDAEAMRIDSAGRLLVGTTSGTHELTVVGSTEQRGTTGGGSVVREVGFVTPTDTTSTATITFGSTTSWRAGIVKVSASVTDTDGTDSGFAASYYGVRFVNSAATVITGTANIATSANLVLSTSTANGSMTVTATTAANNLTIVWDVEVLSRQPNTAIAIAA